MNRNVIVKRIMGSMIGGGIVGALLAIPSQASAWWLRQHPSDCVMLGPGFAFSNFGAQGGQTYLCPVPDDSSMTKTSITTANVESWQATNNGVQAKACFADWNGQTGGCDNPIFVAGVNVHRTVALGGGNGFWDTDGGGDFGFIHIFITNAGSRMAGIFYAG